MNLRNFCFLLLAICTVVHAKEQIHEPWEVTCKMSQRFRDGDTLTCVSDSEDRGMFVVRFAGIDAPEVGQAFWRVSRDKLQDLAARGTRASCYKTDQYGREVCRLYSPDGTDLAAAMLSAGLVWHATSWSHEQTVDERQSYAALESQAREAKLGLWSDPDPMNPSVCRQMKKKRQRCR